VDAGAELPDERARKKLNEDPNRAWGPGIYLTDTLESPHTSLEKLGLLYEEITRQHELALKVKEKTPVLVCLGNPPYDRHEAVDPDSGNLAKYGGWVRFGDPLVERAARGKGEKSAAPTQAEEERSAERILKERERGSILYSAFVEPTIEAGHGQHVKNLYNLYVYFWRWALWKVFEANTAAGPGVVSFISASSYLDGEAFVGMRQHMRRVCDEIWILDLGGEGRGTRRNENVFAIQTPVAIAVAVRYEGADPDCPAKVHYTRIRGTENEKRSKLDGISDIESLDWERCHKAWQAPFRPVSSGHYFNWPLLTDLLPWRLTGVMAGRTWVIAPTQRCLKERWSQLLRCEGSERAEPFVENRTGRDITDRALSLEPARERLERIQDLPTDASCPRIVRFGFRYLDRQYLIADGRLIDRPSPDLWAHSASQQAYFVSLFNHPLGRGPAITAFSNMPDKHAFRGSYGGKNVFPIYRHAAARAPNLCPGLLDVLREGYGNKVTAEDIFAYIYGILAQPAFTDRFYEEVAALDQEGRRQLRVPITKSPDLFDRVRRAGSRLLWIHTYGQRYVPPDRRPGEVPHGKARCQKTVPATPADYPEQYHYDRDAKTLHVGDGEFAPVEPEVYEFEVSGLKVVQSWLGYRMKDPKGRRSSPLDEINVETWPSEFTTELLELLWVLEATVEQYPAQADLLEEVVDGECFTETDLPEVPPASRKAPKPQPTNHMFEVS
jgi:hypothetical protein